MKFILNIVLSLALVGCASNSVNNPQVSSPYKKDPKYLTAPSSFTRSIDWNILGNKIINHPDNTVYIYWQGRGGEVRIGHEFVDKIEEAQRKGKRVVLIVTGWSYSMHGNIPCFVDAYRGNSGTGLMFHRIGVTINGKRYIANTYRGHQDELYWFTQCERSGILTKHDVDMLFSNHEVWINLPSMNRSYRKDPRPLLNN